MFFYVFYIPAFSLMLALGLHFLSILAAFGLQLGTPGHPLDALGTLLGGSWDALGRSGSLLGRSWGVFWPLWAATAATEAVL